MNIKCHIRLPFGLTNNNKMSIQFFSLAGVWCVVSKQNNKHINCGRVDVSAAVAGDGAWRQRITHRIHKQSLKKCENNH